MNWLWFGTGFGIGTIVGWVLGIRYGLHEPPDDGSKDMVT